MDKPVGEMTREELKQMIRELLVDETGNQYAMINGLRVENRRQNRPKSDILESIRSARISLPPDAPSSVELLREDRDR